MIANSSGCAISKAQQALEAIQVVHPYGCLNSAPHWHDSSRRFVFNSTPDAVRVASEGIRVVGERGSQSVDACFDQARELIAQSERLVFLGVGFEQTTIDRLGVRDYAANAIRGRRIWSTGYGLLPMERSRAASLFGSFGSRLHFGGNQEDCLNYLRSTVPLD